MSKGYEKIPPRKKRDTVAVEYRKRCPTAVMIRTTHSKSAEMLFCVFIKPPRLAESCVWKHGLLRGHRRSHTLLGACQLDSPSKATQQYLSKCLCLLTEQSCISELSYGQMYPLRVWITNADGQKLQQKIRNDVNVP